MCGATWSIDDSELHFVCVDTEGIAYVVESVIMDEVGVVYSDHVAVCLSIKWKVKKKIQQKKHM